MLRRQLHSLTAVAAIAALATATGTGVAAAAKPSAAQSGVAKTTMKRHVAKRAPGTTAPVPTAGSTAVAISAFPTGDAGSGSEATCGLWSDRLQEDVEILGDADSVGERVDASNQLQEDKDSALDAGCVVID